MNVEIKLKSYCVSKHCLWSVITQKTHVAKTPPALASCADRMWWITLPVWLWSFKIIGDISRVILFTVSSFLILRNHTQQNSINPQNVRRPEGKKRRDKTKKMQRRKTGNEETLTRGAKWFSYMSLSRLVTCDDTWWCQTTTLTLITRTHSSIELTPLCQPSYSAIKKPGAVLVILY